MLGKRISARMIIKHGIRSGNGICLLANGGVRVLNLAKMRIPASRCPVSIPSRVTGGTPNNELKVSRCALDINTEKLQILTKKNTDCVGILDPSPNIYQMTCRVFLSKFQFVCRFRNNLSNKYQSLLSIEIVLRLVILLKFANYI